MVWCLTLLCVVSISALMRYIRQKLSNQDKHIQPAVDQNPHFDVDVLMWLTAGAEHQSNITFPTLLTKPQRDAARLVPAPVPVPMPAAGAM